MDLFLQQTTNALALGGTYALLALGLAVVFSIMGLIASTSGLFGEAGVTGTTACDRARLSACWMPCWAEVSFRRPRKYP